MVQRFEKYQHIAGTTFPRHMRGVDLLGALSIVALIGVSVTGAWEFFTHTPDPSFAGYRSGGNRLDEEPRTVVSQIHDIFATATGIIALVGTVWFAYRISHRLPALGVVAFIIAVFGSLVGGSVRFNVVKVQGQPPDVSESGYFQVFRSDLEFAVTSAGEISAQSYQLIVASHVATVPVLLAFAYLSIRRGIDRRYDELVNQPKRTWFTGDR